jgi:hypothetical protein
MKYSKDYEEVKKLFDELSVYDRKLFIESHSDLIDIPTIDDMDDDEIIAAAEDLGLVNIDDLSSSDLMDIITNNFWILDDDDIEEIKELIK